MPVPDHPSVAIFWDYENCCPPSSSSGLGYDIVVNIRRVARLFGSVSTFRAYLDISAQSPKSVALRSELQSSGVSMLDCPHNGKKDVVDKMILVDMLAFAIDHPAPATVFLITGDRDYSYAVSTLRLRNYHVVLVVPSPQASPSLESQASLVIDWASNILRARPEVVAFAQGIRQHDLDLDPRLLRELHNIAHDDPDTALLHPCPTSTVRRTSFRDLDQSKHPKHMAFGAIDSVPDPTFAHALLRKSTIAGNDLAPGGLPIPKTPSRSRGASVSTGSTRARSATTVAQSVEDIPPKNPPPSGARRSSASDIADAPGPANRSLSFISSRPDTLELPLHDNRPPSSINVRSPLEPAQSTEDGSQAPSSHRLNCLASPFVMPKAPPVLESAPIPSSESRTEIKPTSPIVPPTKSLVEPVTGVSNTPQTHPMGVPSELDQGTCRRVENDDQNSEQAMPHRPRTKEGASDVTNTPQLNHHSSAASSASSGDAGLQPADSTPSYHPASPPEAAYLGTTDAVDPAQLQPTVSPRASNAPDHSTRGFGSVPSSSACPSASLTASELHEHDETERRQTWTKFKPLVQVLLVARQRGEARSPRSIVATELIHLDKCAYQRAGVARFKDYTALAERAGIIELGGTQANAWIALHPVWFDRVGVMPAPCLSNGSEPSLTSDPPNAMENPLPMVGNTSVNDTPAIVTAPAPELNSLEYNDTRSSISADRHRTPARFQPLIDILIQLREEGTYVVLRSLVGQALTKDIYAHAGVSSFKEYIQQAWDAQVIQCGGDGGHAWICLDPELLI